MDKLFDTVIRLYEQGIPIKEISKRIGVSPQKVRKIMITVGLYHSGLSEKIQQMYNSGMSEKDIADVLNLSSSTINSHLPYSKCMYNQMYPTINAIRIRKSRSKVDGVIGSDSDV